MSTLYTYSNKSINELQQDIMRFVIAWIKEQKTPVPRKEILAHMESEGVKSFTVSNALNTLLRKGYIRRAHSSFGQTTSYVQLRTI